MGDPAKPKQKKDRTPSLGSLPKEAERHLRQNSKETLEDFWAGVGAAMKRGEKWAFEMVARIYAYDKAPGGVTIYNQHLQLNGAAANSVAGSARVRSLDQIISRLDVTEEGQKFLTAQQDVDVIDIEPEDPVEEELSDDDLAGIEEAAGGVPAI